MNKDAVRGEIGADLARRSHVKTSPAKVRIRGSAGGVRLSVLYIGVVPLLIFASWLAAGYIAYLPLLLVTVAIAVRSAFLGVFVVDRQLVVVSWFKTWRFEDGEVKKVVWRRYRGFYNGFQDDDSRLTWMWVIGLDVEMKGKRRRLLFPSTIGSRTRVERVANSMATRLGIRAVRTHETLG